jgi:hypothetical protein
MDNWKDMSNGKKGAFACETNAKWNLGLTKREYFAGLAMQGLLANPKWLDVIIEENQEYSETIVRGCLDIPDELLKQLES